MRSWTAIASVVCLWCGMWTQSHAGTMLLDFEQDSDVRVWHDERRTTLGGGKRLERVKAFAASGAHSMRFSTPAWRPSDHGGRSTWPAFEGTPPITDWSSYDRLVMEIVNVTAAPQRLMLFVTDSKRPTRSGLIHRETLPPFGHVQAVVDLKRGFAQKKVNPRDVQKMHFYTEDPPVDMVLHIDRLVLLKAGEPLPTLPAPYLREFAALQAPAIEATRQAIAEATERLAARTVAMPRLAQWVGRECTALKADVSVAAMRARAASPSVLSLAHDLARFRERAAALEARLNLMLEFENVRPKVEVAGGQGGSAVVGFADSMTKVLPRADIPALATSSHVDLCLARNEKEAFQVIVVPTETPLRQVTVRVRDLRGPKGAQFPADRVDAVPVGYVQTKVAPPYGSPHVGWWPDPILDFMTAADIAKGDAQAFWVRVRAPKGQAPGRYTGKLDVLVGGRPAFTFDLAIRVYRFTLPDASPLPLAITFGPHDHPTADTKPQQAEWRKSKDYPVNAWRAHVSEWVDLLADYYITCDSLYEYSGWQPKFDQLKRLHARGQLGRFNLGYYRMCPADPAGIAKWKAEIFGRLRPRYQRAKALGILDHAYIYGCDEHKAKDFPHVGRAAKLIKAEFPDVMVMTTTYDHSYGLGSPITAMDAFCPLTPRFDLAKVAKARAAGKQVWWYICCGPRHPHANMFVEYPAIEGRLLMGALTAKYRPDGFLYYQISIWNSQHPITGGPFTNWDPRSWTSYHGDGSWTCVGPGGTPLATVRLENFRDGLDDYAYVRILEATLARVEASPKLKKTRAAWIAKAKARLVVPKDVAASKTVYTRDPALLRSWRNALAEAIESAGVEAVEPWATTAP